MSRAGYFPPEADLALWIIQQGLTGRNLDTMTADLAGRLIEAGIPLMRFFVAMPVVSPDLRALSLAWSRDGGVLREEVRHDDADTFVDSPIARMLDTGEFFRRWRLDGTPSGFPVLDQLRRAGATDHVTHLVPFDTTDTLTLKGVALSFTTDAAAGFSDFDLERLSRFAPLIGISACRFALSSLVTDVLDAYLGHDAGRRVLRGEIRRGEGHQVRAALLFADLRSFTVAAEASGPAIVPRLGRHLAAMAEPISETGGEILKFMGDGLLAAWGVEQDGIEGACAKALGAACEALRRNELIAQGQAGEQPLGLDVALHLGEVFYGNIGAAGRLDFTVIGPAVNEASRIEGLCGQLGHPLLMSSPFAAACGRPTVSLGRHRLRNVADPREIHTLRDV